MVGKQHPHKQHGDKLVNQPTERQLTISRMVKTMMELPPFDGSRSVTCLSGRWMDEYRSCGYELAVTTALKLQLDLPGQELVFSESWPRRQMVLQTASVMDGRPGSFWVAASSSGDGRLHCGQHDS
jgi:hypothetical protein